MEQVIALIGFGEAGQAFAKGWRPGQNRLRAYDIKVLDPDSSSAMQHSFEQLCVAGCKMPGEAVSGATAVICLVPTDQFIAAAEVIAPLLDTGTFWIDGSSSAPATKRRAAQMVEQGGGRYIDMAIMAPVLPRLHRTPVLLSGTAAVDAQELLSSLGMEANTVGKQVGQASTVKMLRSIIIKGIEALSAECFLAARKAGVEELVLNSLVSSGELIDWNRLTSYNIGRMVEHGGRRAAEMREVALTLKDLGMPDWMSSSAALWQDRLAGLRMPEDIGELAGSLDSVLATFK